MRRAVARFIFVTLLGTLAVVLGVVTSMTLTPPGRDLLARTISEGLDRVLIGHVDVGGISGSFLYDLDLERLVVRDTQGVLLADLPRVHVSYRLPNLLSGRYVLSSLHVDDPVINLIKHRNGRMNYEEVLGLGKKKGPGGPSPLIQFEDVQVHNGTLRIALPWNPPSEADTPGEIDSVLAAERAKPGRQIADSREGLRRVIRFEQLTAFMPRLRIASPDRRPFTIDLDTLATRISDPQVRLTDAVGRLSFPSDSVVFSFERAAMANTVVAGGGAVTWPRDTTLFDFQLLAPQVDLADLRWISPDFPDMTGRGRLHAVSVSGARTRYALPELHLAGPGGRLDGELVAITDRAFGLGVDDMRLRVQDLDLDVARAYLDSLPFFGHVTGNVRGGGWLVNRPLALDVDILFRDEKVAGTPVTTVAGSGRIIASQNPDSGLTFAGFDVRRSNVDLGTVRRIAPAVILEGRLAAVGRLEGPLQDVTFTGRAVHRHGERPESVAEGVVHLDTRRDTLGLFADVDLAPLAFEGIRAAFPTLGTRGEVRGHVTLDGRLSRMAVDATLVGDIGRLDAVGVVTMLPPHWGADSLHLRFEELDLAALRGTGPTTRLAGAMTVAGSIDTLRAPEGSLALTLGPSSIREWRLDSLLAEVAVVDSVVRLDTLAALWRGARAYGSGTLGWTAPHAGTMRIALDADSLVAFDSLALALTGQTRRDTALRALSGTADGEVTLTGALDSLVAEGSVTGRALAFQQLASPEVRAEFVWRGEMRPRLQAALRADTLGVGALWFRGVGLDVAGYADSLGWAVASTLGLADRVPPTTVAAAGDWQAPDSAAAGAQQTVLIDSLAATLLGSAWRLEEAVRLSVGDSALEFSPVHLVTRTGSGLLRFGGRWPGDAPGDVSIEARGLELADVYTLIQRDTAGINGRLGLDLRVGGTAASPTIEGSATLGQVRVGDSRAPFVQAVVDYADRRLDATLRLWDTGEQILDVETSLPVDLAFTEVETRKQPGLLTVRAHADSMDLAIVEAFTPTVRRVRGTLAADARITGTWDRPRLEGFAELRDAAMSMPGLGVRFDDVRGRVALQGDSLVLDNVFARSAEGRLDVDGVVRLDSLTTPVLALDMRANQFHAAAIPDFLDVTVTGEMHLRGPVFGATLTGEAEADRGVLYFADLLNKRVIDLEDPTNADLVDTLLIRERRLGTAFQARFLDSLRIRNFQFGVGGDFWLRSNEANIQLTGRDLRVNKFRDEYHIEGTLTALRGTYDLKIGPVTRTFDVQRGSVTYEGTPDLNARLDIRAQHVVRTAQNQDLPIVAIIGGTLFQPQLELTTGQNIAAGVSDVDLVSYLIFGVPSSQAQPGELGQLQNIASFLSPAAFNELERALISDLGLPIDVFEIRPGVGGIFGSPATGGSVTQVAAGLQIGQRVFLTLSAGFCDLRQFSYENLGAGIEVRFSQAWRAQLAFEPTLRESCGVTGFESRLAPNARYQVGFDLFWEREF
jgi:hypothetical protein